MSNVTCVEGESSLAFAESFVQAVYEDLNDVKHSFFRIGFRLYEASNMRYYAGLGYANIADLALDKFGFSKSTTYELIRIYEMTRGEAPLLMSPEYDKFSQSQLRELCRLNYCADTFKAIVKPTDNVADISGAVTYWNKYVSKHGGSPAVNSIKELLALKAREDAQKCAYAEKSGLCNEIPVAQIPVRQGLDLAAEKPETGKKCAYAENTAETPAQPAELSTGGIIETCLKQDRRKNEIYGIYAAEQPSKEEFIKLLKKLYGTGGETWEYGGYKDKTYSPAKGITLSDLNGRSLIISWSVAASRIKKLIEANRYLTEDEYAAEPDKPMQAFPELTVPEENTEEPEELPEYSEPAERRERTVREYLSGLPTEKLADAILVKILNIYPFRGESSRFLSMLRQPLTEWLNKPYSEK